VAPWRRNNEHSAVKSNQLKSITYVTFLIILIILISYFEKPLFFILRTLRDSEKEKRVNGRGFENK